MGKISSINGYDLYDAESRSIANEAKETAQAAAAKIPAGGNAGQVLTKTEEGLAWQDPSSDVTISDNEDGGIDVTVDEVTKTVAKQADVSLLKESITKVYTATSDDVGKALKAKTVEDGQITEWEFGETGGSVSPEEIEDAVSDWFEEHPEATTTVSDGSLTIDKLSDDLKLYTMNDYVTPEMFGAVGDGVADDTLALQNMASSENSRFYFPNKTYVINGSIDFNNACIIDFDHTTITTDKTNVTKKPFDYMVGFRAIGIHTRGKVKIKGINVANIGLYIDKSGNSTFGEIECTQFRLWGVYVADNLSNGSMVFQKLVCTQCGTKLSAKAKYISSDEIEITDIANASGETKFNSYSQESKFDVLGNEWNQFRYIIDDSGYSRNTDGSRSKRVVFTCKSSNKSPFTYDAETNSGSFDTTGLYVGSQPKSDYVSEDGSGRLVFIPIGGGIYMPMSSEGVFSFDYLHTQRCAMSMYCGMSYGGTIRTYISDFDGLLIATQYLYALSINYLYLEGVGTGMKDSEFKRILLISYNNASSIIVTNPFNGTSRETFDDSNVIPIILSNTGIADASNIFVSVASKLGKLSSPNYISQSSLLKLTVNELSPRVINVKRNGVAGNNNSLVLDVYDVNNINSDGFSPLEYYCYNTNVSLHSFVIGLSDNAKNNGYSINGTTDNGNLTLDTSECGERFKVTVVLFGKEFFCKIEPWVVSTGTVSDSHINDLIDQKLGTIETLLGGGF